MIQSEDIKRIPRFMWSETSAKEFAMMPFEAHEALVNLSDPVKMITKEGKPLLVAGLFRRSFFSTPYLWVLLTNEFRNATPATLRAIIRITNKFAPKVETLVERDNARAERLAKTFGFTPTDGMILVSDREYQMYRRGE